MDNIRSSQVTGGLGSRTLTHQYGDGTNRLTGLSGSQSVAVAYDARGNVVQRGSRSFTFDIANRMRAASGAVSFYDYDGFGRRSWVAFADGRTQLNAYGWADPTGATGRLLFSEHSHQGQTRYVYLGGKLIAEHNAQTGVRFAHTDALGSPVAWTSASGTQVAAVTRYEPYGGTAEGPQPASIGFTGHVNDGQTGLVYMQQRYYDPIAGRFLSIDPVTTNAKDGSFFGRYHYANNNPYKFKDPDGRAPGSFDADGGDGSGLPVSPIVTLQILAHQNGASPSAAVGLAAAATAIVTRGAGGPKTNAASPGSKPLLGQNPKYGGSRTNTDVQGDRATAKSIFRHETKGQTVTQQPTKDRQGILRQSEDGTKIRMNSDGTTRVDLPGRGPLPNGETIHIPPKEK